MKSSFTLFAAAGLAFVPAVLANENVVADIESRQEMTEDRSECHASCGYAILGAEEDESHCDNSTWTGLLDDCLECADEFDIWQHYGNGVSDAADSCDIDATPVAASGSGASATSTSSDSTSTSESEESEEEEEDDDSAAASMTSSASVMLFAMIAAAGLM